LTAYERGDMVLLSKISFQNSNDCNSWINKRGIGAFIEAFLPLRAFR
jgi:hypothetical protein